MPVELSYGLAGRCRLELDPRRIRAARMPPPPLGDLAADLRAALEHPLDFPAFEHLFTEGDHVTLVLDRGTPQAATLIAEVWRILKSRGVPAENVLILQPAGFTPIPSADPRALLPDDAREKFQWRTHDPTQAQQMSYLASTARGERVYLARDMLDADVVVSLGFFAFDPVIGYRGTGSVFYPGLSSTDAIARAHGLSHSELELDDERPLRQSIDEITWLVGAQFTIQVVPAAGEGVSAVIAGAVEPVSRRGRRVLVDQWMLKTEERVPIVIAAVDADASGHGWEQVASALAAARCLVTKGGRIILLSEVAEEIGPGLQMIRESRSPRNAVQPLRKHTPPDWIAATQMAMSADWAHVHLLSKVPASAVESLFLIPLDNDRDIQRLLNANPDEACILLASAQHSWGTVTGTPAEA